MSLQPGDKLGPYEVVALLGKGGMGEVYRARDPKLNREVAVKVLPPGLANDGDYLTRFQREAQTLASLNHPNIAAIYGLEENAIVMELVEGDTLKGPLALKDALPIARQIAEALEAAHDKGIIHRDLKPGNIKVTPEGIVKVLDFGLAKAVNERATQSGANSPTLTLRATEAGLILGTAAYMAPEQAAGKPVDRRADIWSFGVVLYELLTGKQLFDGETVTHTLADVVRAPIDLSVIEDSQARQLLARCLDRSTKTRLQHIGEARIAIESHSPTQSQAAAPATSNRGPWVIAAALSIALFAVSWLYFRQPAPSNPVISTAILPPANVDFDFTRPHATPAISPDGTRIVFGAKSKDGPTQLWIRRLDSPTAQLLPGTEGAATPFWSPDSRWVAFGQDRKLRKIDVQGGPPVAIADIPSALRGGSWNREGEIIAGFLLAGPILRVSASGGTPAPVTPDEKQRTSHRHPWFLPDGRHFLYQNGSEMVIGSLDTPGDAGKRIMKTESPAVYAQGHLLYLRESTLMAQPFDAARLETTGDALPLAEGVPTFTVGSRIPGFTVSQAGLLAYQSGGSDSQMKLVWKDRNGKTLGTLGSPADYIRGVAISPDGKQVTAAVGARASGGEDIWIFDAVRNVSTRFTFDNSSKIRTTWSPDGKWIYFNSVRPNHATAIFRMAAIGAGAEEMIGNGSLGGISPDGKLLLIRGSDARSGRDNISTLALSAPAGTAKPEPSLLMEAVSEYYDPEFSPDGRWVLYGSNEAGSRQLYVAPFPGPGGKRQISRNSAAAATWSRNGSEIFYVEPNAGQLITVPVFVRDGALEFGQERKLMEGIVIQGGLGRPYAVAPDGQKFLVVDSGTAQNTSPLILLQNWTATLKK